VMKNFRLELDGDLDGIGNEAILLGLFQDPRRPDEILRRSDHEARLNNHLDELVTRALHFFEFTGLRLSES
jgi:hypothetical protein